MDTTELARISLPDDRFIRVFQEPANLLNPEPNLNVETNLLLHEFNGDVALYNEFVRAIVYLALAHYAKGVDITTDGYREGLMNTIEHLYVEWLKPSEDAKEELVIN